MEYKIGDIVRCRKSDKLLRIKSLCDDIVICDDERSYIIEKDVEYILCSEYANEIESKWKNRAEVAEKALRDMCKQYEDDIDCDYGKECYSEDFCYMCDYKIRLQKAKESIKEEIR